MFTGLTEQTKEAVKKAVEKRKETIEREIDSYEKEIAYYEQKKEATRAILEETNNLKILDTDDNETTLYKAFLLIGDKAILARWYAEKKGQYKTKTETKEYIEDELNRLVKKKDSEIKNEYGIKAKRLREKQIAWVKGRN